MNMASPKLFSKHHIYEKKKVLRPLLTLTYILYVSFMLTQLSFSWQFNPLRLIEGKIMYFTVFLSRFHTYLESFLTVAKQSVHFSQQFIQIANYHWSWTDAKTWAVRQNNRNRWKTVNARESLQKHFFLDKWLFL